MPDHAATRRDGGFELRVARARDGDRDALEEVVRAVYKDVYALALRFLWHPQDAEDASQEILIRVITGLAGFRGDSSFRTWVYRIACNTLLTLRRQRMEERALSFDEFTGIWRAASRTSRWMGERGPRRRCCWRRSGSGARWPC